MFRPITRIPGLPGRTSLLFVSAAWRDDLSASSRLSQVALRYRKHAAKPNLLQVTAVQRLTLLYRGQPVVPGGFRPASLATYHRLRLLRLRRASPRLVCGVRQRRSSSPGPLAFVPITGSPTSPILALLGWKSSQPRPNPSQGRPNRDVPIDPKSVPIVPSHHPSRISNGQIPISDAPSTPSRSSRFIKTSSRRHQP